MRTVIFVTPVIKKYYQFIESDIETKKRDAFA